MLGCHLYTIFNDKCDGSPSMIGSDFIFSKYCLVDLIKYCNNSSDFYSYICQNVVWINQIFFELKLNI